MAHPAAAPVAAPAIASTTAAKTAAALAAAKTAATAGTAAAASAGTKAALAAPAAASGGTKAALVSGLLTGGAGVASGLLQSLLPDKNKQKEDKIGMPSANPGQIGSNTSSSPLFAGRQDFSTQPRNSLAMQLLQGGYK